MQINDLENAERMQTSEQAARVFKQMILKETAAFEQTPDADLYRVQLLAAMLERYDHYVANGAEMEPACAYVTREFSDLKKRMRDQEFEEYDLKKHDAQVQPLLTVEEAAEYIRQSAVRARRRAAGTAVLWGSFVPVVLSIALEELLNIGMDVIAALGGICFFAMIGFGIYLMVTAKKPVMDKRIRKKQFSMSRQLRRKLTDVKAAALEKARRGKKRGFILLGICPLAFMLGAAIGAMMDSDELALMMCLGVVSLLIGAGHYQLLTAGAEKKAVDRILRK